MVGAHNVNLIVSPAKLSIEWLGAGGAGEGQYRGNMGGTHNVNLIVAFVRTRAGPKRRKGLVGKGYNN